MSVDARHHRKERPLTSTRTNPFPEKPAEPARTDARVRDGDREYAARRARMLLGRYASPTPVNPTRDRQEEPAMTQRTPTEAEGDCCTDGDI
jgi:hypothetical protein